jgi:hypothetical protein
MVVSTTIGTKSLKTILHGKSWSILNVDTFKEVSGQFQAEGIEETRNNSYAEAPVYRQEGPILQFIRKEIDTMTFQARFFSDSIVYSLLDKYNEVLALTEPDPIRDRPPLCLFVCGEIGWFDNVIIKSVGPIKHGDPAFWGRMRTLDFSITMQRHIPFTISSSPALESMYYPCGVGETFETVAEKVYGSAILATYLRYKNPDMTECAKEKTIKVPEKKLTKGWISEPKSVVFDGREDTEEQLLSMYDRRAYSVVYPDIDGTGM